jgi:hypothetical protein
MIRHSEAIGKIAVAENSLNKPLSRYEMPSGMSQTICRRWARSLLDRRGVRSQPAEAAAVEGARLELPR